MSNVNVMLTPTSEPKRRFPCPLCVAQLDLRTSRRAKPYCVCDACGIQIFFRGRTGIARLHSMLDEHDQLTGSVPVIATPAVAAFNRLAHLRAQQSELKQRRSIFSTDDDLEHAIQAVDVEIGRLQIVLEQLSAGSKS